ncbi:uncharacterized protein LOC118562728 isoform X1 [Fundulus heteroclitus]|uniref:uncharacterized protein LOC118562728 isoform X1 n=1 Tax=Fundulus heteroclitus TaxID=8078 RepID=UPI00165BA9B0|nr:uncharacterized protein LOC118562728 isoform X1 [Fundulus heteroclitus]
MESTLMTSEGFSVSVRADRRQTNHLVSPEPERLASRTGGTGSSLAANGPLGSADCSAGEPGLSRHQNQHLMDAPELGSLYLRSSSTVSLNERFSQVLRNQLTRPDGPIVMSRGTLPLQPGSRRRRGLLPQRMKLRLGSRRRRSIWTRLGGPLLSRHRCRFPGFWSFRRKYSWRARSSAPYRSLRLWLCLLDPTCVLLCWFSTGRGNLHLCLGRCRLVRTGNPQTPTAGARRWSHTAPRGGATSVKGRGFLSSVVPTKQQLDAQLDEYMSLSRRRLDQQLEDYMSMSRRRLDEELDEYMLRAGQSLED